MNLRILQRYLVREIMGPFFFGVSAFAAILLGFALINLAKNPFLRGETVLRLTMLQIPENLALAFPMGSLLGTLFSLGRLSGHSEVVAMRAAGLSNRRLFLPFAIFGLCASLASLGAAEVLTPRANRIIAREYAEAVGAKSTGVVRRQVLPPEYGPDGRLRRLIHVGEFDLNQLYLRDVEINEYEAGRLKSVMHADEMSWDGNAWRFLRGQMVFFAPDGMVSRLTVVDGRASYRPLLPKPREIAAGAADPRALTWRAYREYIAARARRGEDVRRLEVDLHSRLAIPFACLALTMIGAPLGVQTRRSGTAISFGLSIAGLISYFFLLSFAQVLGRTGALPPVLAAWFANLALFAAGVALMIKRSR